MFNTVSQPVAGFNPILPFGLAAIGFAVGSIIQAPQGREFLELIVESVKAAPLAR